MSTISEAFAITPLAISGAATPSGGPARATTLPRAPSWMNPQNTGCAVTFPSVIPNGSYAGTLTDRLTRHGPAVYKFAMNAWYETLKRPPLTPPSWVFAPAWTGLYAMIAVSIFLYFRSHPKPHLKLAAVILTLHLASNFAWTWLFFGLRAPGIALADILFLDVSLVALVLLFWPASRLAALLLVPYLAWVLFATYLNAGFYRLN